MSAVGDSNYTNELRDLIRSIFDDRPTGNSVYQQAAKYFEALPQVNERRAIFEEKIAELEKKISVNSNKKETVKYLDLLDKAQNDYEKFNQKQEDLRVVRHNKLRDICLKILSLSEGSNFTETNKKSAKLLGSIQLISPAEGKRIAPINERHKHIYRAVLSLRLLDRMYLDSNIDSKYIISKMDNNPELDVTALGVNNEELLKVYREQVQLPIVMAAILQDIGNFHLDAVNILKGENGDLNPYRVLEPDSRKALLKINYSETLKYVSEGIGPGKYIGNSKQDRERFNKIEDGNVAFIRNLLKNGVNPKQGCGNIIKVPQIYTSIILSTKANYNYQLLPKVYNVLYKSAEMGGCNQKAVDGLLQITGHFPQGYGVTFIPLNSDGVELDRYEYAIVTGLYPNSPWQPHCRLATRNLQFISHGSDSIISKDKNLYIPGVSKKLEKVSTERLREILKILSSNYEEGIELELIPKCWFAREFFSLKKNQNLWNKAKQDNM